MKQSELLTSIPTTLWADILPRESCFFEFANLFFLDGVEQLSSTLFPKENRHVVSTHITDDGSQT